MPLYSNKQPIESLGGNCILWRARFESADNELRCTIPPADVEVTSWSIGPNRYAGAWEITIDAPGELDLLSFDISHNEQPLTGRGFPTVQWVQQDSKLIITFVNWDGQTTPVFAGPGDAVMISVWFQNTSIGRTYARQTA